MTERQLGVWILVTIFAGMLLGILMAKARAGRQKTSLPRHFSDRTEKEELSQLKERYSKGSLTELEYQVLREEIMAKYKSRRPAA